jgi:hypothetical protein
MTSRTPKKDVLDAEMNRYLEQIRLEETPERLLELAEELRRVLRERDTPLR